MSSDNDSSLASGGIDASTTEEAGLACSPMSIEERRSVGGNATVDMSTNSTEEDDDDCGSSVYRSTASSTAESDFVTAPPTAIVSERERHSDLIYTCPAYVADVHAYLKHRQEATRARSGYMRKQPEVCVQMRQILVDWLVDVTTEYDLHQETLHLAVNYIDRMMSRMEIPRLKLQLLGTTAMMIAAKYEEIYPPELTEFVYITDDTYTKRQVLRMEQVVLTALEFDLAAPTCVWFIGQYTKLCRASTQTCKLAQYLSDLSIIDYDYLQYRPSHVAGACVCLANLITGRVPWPTELEELSGTTVVDIYGCLTALLASFKNAKHSPQRAVYDKYSQSDFNAVAVLDAPDSLPHIS